MDLFWVNRELEVLSKQGMHGQGAHQDQVLNDGSQGRLVFARQYNFVWRDDGIHSTFFWM